MGTQQKGGVPMDRSSMEWDPSRADWGILQILCYHWEWILRFLWRTMIREFLYWSVQWGNAKSVFGFFWILSDLRIQSWIFSKKCTLMLLTEQKSGFGRKRDKKQKIQKTQLTTSSRQKMKTRMTSSWVELTCNKTVFSEPPWFFSEPQIWKSWWPAIFVLCLWYLEYRYWSLFISLREIWWVIYFVVRTYSAIRRTLRWDQISIEQALFSPKTLLLK